MNKTNATIEQKQLELLAEHARKEDAFFERYGMPQGLKTIAFKAYSSFLTSESKYLNNNAWIYQTPMARKMFMLGYLYAWTQVAQENKHRVTKDA